MDKVETPIAYLDAPRSRPSWTRRRTPQDRGGANRQGAGEGELLARPPSPPYAWGGRREKPRMRGLGEGSVLIRCPQPVDLGLCRSIRRCRRVEARPTLAPVVGPAAPPDRSARRFKIERMPRPRRPRARDERAAAADRFGIDMRVFLRHARITSAPTMPPAAAPATAPTAVAASQPGRRRGRDPELPAGRDRPAGRHRHPARHRCRRPCHRRRRRHVGVFLADVLVGDQADVRGDAGGLEGAHGLAGLRVAVIDSLMVCMVLSVARYSAGNDVALEVDGDRVVLPSCMALPRQMPSPSFATETLISPAPRRGPWPGLR